VRTCRGGSHQALIEGADDGGHPVDERPEMQSDQHPSSPEELVYRDRWTGELRPLNDALDASWANALTYERDMEIIATYGMEDPSCA
jgi:hypothetical protein